MTLAHITLDTGHTPDAEIIQNAMKEMKEWRRDRMAPSLGDSFRRRSGRGLPGDPTMTASEARELVWPTRTHPTNRVGVALQPDVVDWVADFERVLAWAQMEDSDE